MKKTTTFNNSFGFIKASALLLATVITLSACQKAPAPSPAKATVKAETALPQSSAMIAEPQEGEEGCSFSQGFYFASPHATWGEVSVGGHVYTYAEAVAIWKSSNKGGISDAKKAFLQVATIYLSGSSVGYGIIWDYVETAEAYLYTLPKLTAANVKNYNSGPDAAAAAGNIGNWIEEHHCE